MSYERNTTPTSTHATDELVLEAEDLNDGRGLSGEELELVELALEIKEWAKQRGMSEASMLKQFRSGLGASRSFNRVLAGDVAPGTVGDNLIKYRAVKEEMGLLERQAGADALCPDLGAAGPVLADLGRFIAQPGLRRFFLIEGPSGSGKTSLLDLLSLKQPAKVLRLNGCQRWRFFEAFIADLLALLPTIDRAPEAVKAKRRRLTLPERMEEVAKRLLASSRVLAIDEAQCLTAPALTFLKDLINRQTMGARLYVVAAGQSTLWRKLEEAAEEEAKQLKHNRLFRRWILEAPDAAACEDYLGRGLEVEQDKAAGEKVYGAMAQTAKQLGHWAFLRNVQEELKQGKVTPIPLKTVAAALARCRRQMGAD
jgi:type II secretory pathway predicted ATPase ExeA